MKEILNKFKNGEELYRENVLFDVCVHHLLHGMDVYLLLEEVILISTSQQKHIKEFIENNPQRIVIESNKI